MSGASRRPTCDPWYKDSAAFTPYVRDQIAHIGKSCGRRASRRRRLNHETTRRYEVISAECHVDLCWLPPDLFTRGASAAMRERMPFVADGPGGPTWKTKRGANLAR